MKEFSFSVNENEANILVASLAKQPFEAVAGLIQKLQSQAAAQLQAADKPVDAPQAEG